MKCQCSICNVSICHENHTFCIGGHFEFKVQNVERDDNGNRLILTIEIEGQLFTLINIYGPNKDDPEFYKQLLLKINEKEKKWLLWREILTQYGIRKLIL